MTREHIIYIPAVFLLGFLFGALTTQKRNDKLTARLQAAHGSSVVPANRISGNVVLSAFLVFILVFVATHFFEIPWGAKTVRSALGGLEIFDKQPSFTSDEVYRRLQAFSPNGISVYKRFTYTIDVLFPAVFFAFLFVLARFVAQQRSLPVRLTKVLLAAPVIWMLTDLLENVMIFRLLTEFPGRNDLLGNSLGMVTAIKFGFLLFSILIPALLITLGKKELKKRE